MSNRGIRGTPKSGTKAHTLANILLRGEPVSFEDLIGRLQATFPARSDRDTRLLVQKCVWFAQLLGVVDMNDQGQYMLKESLHAARSEGTETEA